MHQCYYCEQLFESKERLYEHVEIHSDIERNREIRNRKKKKQGEYRKVKKEPTAKKKNSNKKDTGSSVV